MRTGPEAFELFVVLLVLHVPGRVSNEYEGYNLNPVAMVLVLLTWPKEEAAAKMWWMMILTTMMLVQLVLMAVLTVHVVVEMIVVGVVVVVVVVVEVMTVMMVVMVERGGVNVNVMIEVHVLVPVQRRGTGYHLHGSDFDRFATCRRRTS